MPSGRPPATPIRAAARVVAWGLATVAACDGAAVVLLRSRVASAAVQAAIAEWGAGQAGVAWSDPDGAPPTVAAIGRRAARGLLAGAVASSVVVGLALAFHASALAPNTPSAAGLAAGLAVCLLGAVRDELLLRGVVLGVFGPITPRLDAQLACALAAVAASLASADPSARELVIAALGGLVLSAVWQRDRGAWMAVGANTAWSWGTGTAVRGGLVDLRGGARGWWGGDGMIAASPIAAIVLALIAIVLALRARDGGSPNRKRGASAP